MAPENHHWNAFSAGWIPSDDAVNGRKNGLLQMDNVELDQNGALSLTGGPIFQRTYAAAPHTLASRYVTGVRFDFASCTNGNVYRNSTLLSSGGDTTNAAFGTAFNFSLIASGNYRVKDPGATPINLGVGIPTAAPTVSVPVSNAPYQVYGTLIVNYVVPSGLGSASVIAGTYLQLTANSSGLGCVQTFSGGGPFDMTTLTGLGPNNIGTSTDNDMITFTGYTNNPFGVALQVDVLLVASNSSGDPVTDYYTYRLADLATANFDASSGVFTLFIKRSDFARMGGGSQSWATTFGFRITLTGTAGQVFNLLGNYLGSPTMYMIGGSNAQNGVYQFAQVNVNNTGSYLALSPLGPPTQAISITDAQALITPQNPAGIDTQVNEVWIYARSTGGTNNIGVSSSLNQWYRVLRITSNFSTAYYVNIGDLAAIVTGITVNPKLITVQNVAGGLQEKIYDIIGPLNGRWYYFTANFMYPSDINDPDLVNVGLAVRTCGSNSENFLWARNVAPGVILVGTSLEIYMLTGTFATLADGTIDITYLPLGCKFPPITYDVAIYSGNVYYLSSDGWRSFSYVGINPYNIAGSSTNPGGFNPLLVSPNTDRLYKGDTCYSYGAPNLVFSPGANRFPVVIAKNKLWCFIKGQNRCEVYDFLRQYWRSVNNYSLGVDVTAACATQDGGILAAYGANLYLVDSRSTFGTQAIQILSPVFDGQYTLQRKDPQAVKFKGSTASGTLTLNLIDDLGNTHTIASGFTGNGVEQDFPLAFTTPIKTWQWQLTGTGLSAFNLNNLCFTFEPRPIPTNQILLRNDNFGSAGMKRLRVWPQIIDTLGGNVTATPIIDNSLGPAVTINTAEKLTYLLQFSTDVKGVDYGLILTHASNGCFEYWGALPPEIVQVFPIQKVFDQVGPFDFFKYGKIKEVGIRLYSAAGGSLPYTIFMNDASNATGTILVLPGVDSIFYIGEPKGTSGNIVRIELGPASGFTFSRWTVRLKCALSGRDTDTTWVTLPDQGDPSATQ